MDRTRRYHKLSFETSFVKMKHICWQETKIFKKKIDIKNKIGQPNQCGATLITYVIFTQKWPKFLKIWEWVPPTEGFSPFHSHRKKVSLKIYKNLCTGFSNFLIFIII